MVSPLIQDTLMKLSGKIFTAAYLDDIELSIATLREAEASIPVTIDLLKLERAGNEHKG